MDNKKIGELIAKLRKEKGLTQQELGDKVNVGSRAVSKWECGTTIPDISIINELSEILGISSDELLTGNLKPQKEIKSKNKINNKLNKLKIFLITSTIILIGIITILIYNNNKTYTYNITATEHEKYRVEGHVTYKNNEITIYINEFTLNDNKLLQEEIKSYQYNIMIDNQYIFGYGQNEEDVNARKIYTISDIEKSIKNIHSKKIEIAENGFSKNKLYILLTITDLNNDNYSYNIEMSMYSNK